MPLYSYTSKAGETIVEFYHGTNSHPQRIKRDGVTYERDIAADFAGGRTNTGEHESMAMGYPLHQVPEMVKYYAQHGIDAKFNPNTGARVFANRQERIKAMKDDTRLMGSRKRTRVDFDDFR